MIYTQQEQKFVNELVTLMDNIGYQVLSGACISTEDVPFRDERVERSQISSLCFVSQSLGTYVIFDFQTFGPLCADAWMYRPSLRVRIGANFKYEEHSIFRSKHFSYAEHSTKARLLFSCFAGLAGDGTSKTIPHVVDGEQVPGAYTYFMSWEFKTVVDVCCDQKKDALFFVEDMEAALKDLDKHTQQFTKIFMGSWPPEDKFPNSSNLYWQKWRDNMNLELAQPILSAMRNT